jgi:archaellum biogenesis ATPase FlaH
MSIKDDVEQNNSILFVIPNETYNETLIDIIKQGVNNHKVCYITISKGYAALNIILEKNKIKTDNFFFIDCITKTVKSQKDTDNCTFISSPNSLIELGLAINKTITKHAPEVVIFDSLSTLLIYHKDNIVSKMVQGLSNKFEAMNSKIIFTLTAKDKESILFKNLHMFISKVTEL